jgi:O-acetyl-ADP-ribose deacetylase (regulator of RNase III)
MAKVEVVVGDITKMNVDVIVNAANAKLLAGGGVCGAIFAAAGLEELGATCAEIGNCATGSAAITPSFRLEEGGIKHIVHAVGPIWDVADDDLEGQRRLDEQLAGAYRTSLELAQTVGAESIAFPAISTGIYGFPVERAAAIAARTCAAHQGKLERVLLVAFDESSAAILRSAVALA